MKSKPMYSLRDRLLTLMRASPRGKRLEQYAIEDGISRGHLERCAGILYELGQVVRVRVAHEVWWTAPEHEQTMIQAAAEFKAEARAALEASGTIAARKERERQRRRRAEAKSRERRRAGKPKIEKPAKARYVWPEESWQEPVPLIRSVWELASCT